MNKLFSRFYVRVFTGLLLCVGSSGMAWGQDTITVTAEDEVIIEEFSEDFLYFDLGCNANEWDGYFSPERWQKEQSTGETGGNPPLLSEFIQREENSAHIVFDAEREEMETWSIEIPSDGYLAFRLIAAGASGEEQISVSINGDTPTNTLRTNGIYYSPFLRMGDRFSINIPAGSTAYHWSQLRFHSNYTAVIVRPEALTLEERYEPIRQGRIQRVLFPEDTYGTWPVFDLDGDPLTDFDHIPLRHSTERFEVSYEDEMVEEGNRYFLQRTFTIRERCRRGNWLRRSRKWAVLPIIPD